MGLIGWVVVGFVAGLLAKRLMPGAGLGGFFVTILVGMAGASVGGFLLRLLGGSGTTGVNVWSMLAATMGAIVLLFLYNLVARRTTA